MRRSSFSGSFRQRERARARGESYPRDHIYSVCASARSINFARPRRRRRPLQRRPSLVEKMKSGRANRLRELAHRA